MSTTPAAPIRLAVNGAAGRMGSRVVHLARLDPAFQIVAGIESTGHPRLGQDLGILSGMEELGVPLDSRLPDAVDVVIDFSVPDAAVAMAQACAARQVPIVIATTGLTPDQAGAIEAASRGTAVLRAANLSPAVNLLARLVHQAAAALRGQADIEIVEHHHRTKRDAPSGTALHLAEVAAAAAGTSQVVHGRAGLTGERPRDQIGLHALRGGDAVGEHQVHFCLPGETLVLTHRAQSRDCFAHGALQAARFLAGRPPGIYRMEDVLSL